MSSAVNTGAEREGWPVEIAKSVTVALQLALLALLVDRFRLEHAAFTRVLYLVAIAFPIHHLLPKSKRLPFFVGISIASVFLVFGSVLGGWLTGITLCVIAVCHLPLPFAFRLWGVVGVGLLLGAIRADVITASPFGAIVPIVGSLFMFRVIVYLYDMKHNSAPFDFWRALAYFFLLPNVCFVLFPVIDYRSFCKSYYNDSPFRIYQIGVNWIFRGMVQLILYRAVSAYALVDVNEIVDAQGVLQHMLATYLLYLRVSGDFHIIVGVLHLFGFNLPETHHLYYLASSFTDFWRRINIYWKDFITKLFFYPAFLRMRKLGPTKSMAFATLWAFFATWVLHSYQWFWLRGNPLISVIDVAFWFLLASLVAINVVIESKSKKKKEKDDLRTKLIVAGKTMATFMAIMFLWSMWSAESFESWFGLLSHLRVVTLDSVLFLGGILLTVGIASILFAKSKREWTEGASVAKRAAESPFNFWRPAATVAASAAVLIAMSDSGVQGRLPSQIGMVLEKIIDRHGTARLQQGYYEDLTQVGRFSNELNNVYFNYVTPPPTFEQVSYGPYSECVLDLWLPESNAPTALLIYIHDGGFDSGTRMKARSLPIVKAALERGVAFASLDHRFAHYTKAEAEYAGRTSIQNVLRDCARAIQFLRLHADEYNLDKTRVACFGGSSGAGASMWIGLSDDLADPDNSDPVLRESTRLSAIGMLNGQFTYDTELWKDEFRRHFGARYTETEGRGLDGVGPLFFGLSQEEYSGDTGARERASVDLRGLISSDDPPIFIRTYLPDTDPDRRGVVNHHPYHAQLIAARCEEVGVETVSLFPGLRREDEKLMEKNPDLMLEFFLEHLGVAASSN